MTFRSKTAAARLRRFAGLLLVLSLVAAACGDDDSSSDTTTAAAAATTQVPETTTTTTAPTVDTTEATTPPVTEPTTIEVTDIAGRVVTVKYPVQNMILGEGRQIYVIATLDRDDPFQRVVGWKDDFYRFDNTTYEQYLEVFPDIGDIPNFGDPRRGEFSIEEAIVLNPDVVILNLGVRAAVEEAGFIENLEKVGIPVVFIDYRERPLENTIPSTLLMGQIMGREAEAAEVVAFYQSKMNRVYDQVAALGDDVERPTVFIERAAGLSDCCSTWGAESLGELIERAGGTNIAIGVIPGPTGTLNPEQVVVADPDVYLLTGANWYLYQEEGGFASFGNGETEEEIQFGLRGLADRPVHSTLTSVAEGRFHGIWHQFYNSPYHFAALEAFAQWFYPDTFEGLDADATFREFHELFLPIEYRGGYWGTLAP